jgi:hypothetical protein
MTNDLTRPATPPSEPGHLRAAPDVVVQHLIRDGDAVLLKTSAGTYFGLDPVATVMWTALTETASVPAALRRLSEHFAADIEVIQPDLERLLQDLTDRELLQFTPQVGSG